MEDTHQLDLTLAVEAQHLEHHQILFVIGRRITESN